MTQSIMTDKLVGQFITRFNDFKSKYEVARENAETSTRDFAPGFNIFHFLKVQRSEQFHSDFIAHLLDPRASHGQGHLFLQTFFKTVERTRPAFRVPDVATLAHGIWLIQREVVASEGILDIVLRNPSLKALYVIENKVDAGEQPDQLTRYAAYLARQEKIYPFQGLLFLTLNGRSSETGSEYALSFDFLQPGHSWLA